MRLAAAALAISGCQFMYQGDGSVGIDVWNRSDARYILMVGSPDAGVCFNLPPGALGEVYGEPGDAVPSIRRYSDDGEFLDVITASHPQTLLVVDPGGDVSEQELRYRQGPPNVGLLYDLPEIPELDGQPTPEKLARTRETRECGGPPGSGSSPS